MEFVTIPMNIKYLELSRISDSFQPELLERVQRVITSGSYLNGACLKSFEQNFAQYTGNKYCVGVGNGYDALKISLMTLKKLHGWDDDCEVIVPTLTFVATAMAVVNAGLRVVFVDVDDNGLMDTDSLPAAVTSKTRCIIPVHLYGKMCNMGVLRKLSEEQGLVLLEDAAQCHGAAINNIKPGNLSAAAAYSFYPTKNLGALADAGAIVSNDEEFANMARRIANYGAEEKYIHLQNGENSRLDELNASVLSLKLQRLDEDNAKRRIIAYRYSSQISNKAVTVPYKGNVVDSVFHVYPLRVDNRREFQQYMSEKGIETAIHYPIPCHRQKAFTQYNTLSFPVAEQWAEHEVSLPLTPFLAAEEIDYIIETVNHYPK